MRPASVTDHHARPWSRAVHHGGALLRHLDALTLAELVPGDHFEASLVAVGLWFVSFIHRAAPARDLKSSVAPSFVRDRHELHVPGDAVTVAIGNADPVGLARCLARICSTLVHTRANSFSASFCIS